MRSVRGLGFGEGEGERFEVVAMGARREDEDDEAVVVTVVVEVVVDRKDVMCASSFVYDSASEAMWEHEENIRYFQVSSCFWVLSSYRLEECVACSGCVSPGV